MVKHALLEELHASLDAPRVSDMTKMFVKFMEENGMAGPRPFDRKELKGAEEALDFLKKCQNMLAIVGVESNDRFRRNIGTYAKLTRPAFTSGPDWAYVQSYLRNYQKRAVRSVGIALFAEDGGLNFYVWLWGNLHPSITNIRKHLGWKKWDEERGCYTSIRLHGNRNDIARMVDFSVSASKDLGRAIRRYA